MFLKRTKHIDIRVHFGREVIAQGSVIVKKIEIEDNPADMFTKALPSVKLNKCLNTLQVSRCEEEK